MKPPRKIIGGVGMYPPEHHALLAERIAQARAAHEWERQRQAATKHPQAFDLRRAMDRGRQ